MLKTLSFFIFIASNFLLVSSVCSLAEDENNNIRAPFFEIKSGNDEVLTLEATKDIVTVVYYDTKDVVKKNQALKKEIRQLYKSNKEKMQIVPVIDCSGAIWPVTRIFKSKLKENSRKHGITVYGDWDARMKQDYKVKEDESNIWLIDKRGIIRYYFYGKLEENEIENVTKLLLELMGEK